MTEPFYRLLDPDTHAADGRVQRVVATAATVGPWFADAQHMGPPSALMVRALERSATGGGAGRDGAGSTRLARLTVEILGRVPPGRLELVTGVERPGRTIELAVAELRADGRAVARARGWRLAVADTTGAATDPGPTMPGPENGSDHPRPAAWLAGYLDALEWRWVSGALDEPGPGRVWARLRVPVVHDVDGTPEEPTPWQRLAAVADSTNGAAARRPITEWMFVNTDLTLHTHRAPVGEWIGLDADSVLGPDGAGTAFSVLHDADGPVGRAAQALTVRPR